MPTFPTAAEMSFIGRCAVDVFISYAHIDNQANWVTNFHSALQTRLQELLGTDRAVIWRDVRLDHSSSYRDELRRTVTSSALFLSILTPRYLESDSCREELDTFVAAVKGGNAPGFEAEQRLIRVVKTRLGEETQPPGFDDVLGFEFYESDPLNPDRFREFESQEGTLRFEKFKDRVDDLAQELNRKLRRMRRLRPPAKADTRIVFLARTTSDLERYRASIQSELSGRGHTVLPSEPLPETGPELISAVEALVTKADISVHLLGRRYGVIPEEETRSFGALMYDLAFAKQDRTNFHQLVWIPEDIQNPEEAQQAFLTKVRGAFNHTTSGKSDVFETSFESFKEGLLDVLSRKPAAAVPAPNLKAKAVYLICDQPDLKQEQLEKIKAYLRGRGHPVDLPPFQGEPEELRAMEEELIGDTDAILIYYGTAKDLWVLRKRKNVLKVLSSRQKGRDYARALYLAAPKDDLKVVNYLTEPDRSFREVDGFPPLLLLGDCEDFHPEKLNSFLAMIER